MAWLPPPDADFSQPFWTKESAPIKKEHRGFNSITIARFIIPIRWAEAFDEDPEQYVSHQLDCLLTCFRVLELIKGHDEDYQILAHWNDLPVFLYDESGRTADSTRWEGLLRGYVLVRVRTILLSCSDAILTSSTRLFVRSSLVLDWSRSEKGGTLLPTFTK